METENTTSKFKSGVKPVSEISFSGKDYPVAIGLYAIKGIEKATGKELLKIDLDQSAETTLLKLQWALKQGAKNSKKDPEEITSDLCESIIDANPAIYGDINKTWDDAYGKFWSISEMGNSPAQEAKK